MRFLFDSVEISMWYHPRFRNYAEYNVFFVFRQKLRKNLLNISYLTLLLFIEDKGPSRCSTKSARTVVDFSAALTSHRVSSSFWYLCIIGGMFSSKKSHKAWGFGQDWGHSSASLLQKKIAKKCNCFKCSVFILQQNNNCNNKKQTFY